MVGDDDMQKFHVYHPDEMLALEKLTAKKRQIAISDLIEIAGSALFKSIMKHEFININQSVLIIYGHGNNGKDAINIGMHLQKASYVVSYFQIDALDAIDSKAFDEAISKCDIIIDGIYGIGLRHPVNQLHKALFRKINGAQKFIISIDIPSGIDASNGLIDEVAITADVTLVCHAYKRGNLLSYAKDHHGMMILVDMGFGVIENHHHMLITYDKSDLMSSKRKHHSHKYNYGHVLVIGGSDGMLGAPVLSAHAAFRSGAGLVTWALHRKYQSVHTQLLPEVMKIFYDDEDEILKLIEKKDAIVFGPGMGKSPDVSSKTLRKIIESKIPMIIDADGISSLKFIKDYEIDFSHVIMTPHLKEFERITDQSTTEILKNPIKALAMLDTFNGTILLKGACTLIRHNKYLFYLPLGNPGMAKAGFGDVLSGIIAVMMMHDEPFESAIKAMFIFDHSGNISLKTYGEHSMLPSDLIGFIPHAFK